MQLLDGAEAKAYWGLALNYKPLQALVDVLVAEETINGERLSEVMTRFFDLTCCHSTSCHSLHVAMCNVTGACASSPASTCRAGTP